MSSQNKKELQLALEDLLNPLTSLSHRRTFRRVLPPIRSASGRCCLAMALGIFVDLSQLYMSSCLRLVPRSSYIKKWEHPLQLTGVVVVVVVAAAAVVVGRNKKQPPNKIVNCHMLQLATLELQGNKVREYDMVEGLSECWFRK